MESRTKIAGHPIHPMLIVFPLGLFSTSLVFDLAHVMTKNKEAAKVANAMLASGLIGALLAAPVGTNDWLHIPEGTRAKNVGLVHGVGNLIVTGLFGLSWMMRRNKPEQPSGGAVAISLLAGSLSLGTAWLGGELSYRLGVGVDRGAHLNSPSSLSTEPAAQVASADQLV